MVLAITILLVYTVYVRWAEFEGLADVKRLFIALIVAVVVTSINCGEDSSDGRLETRRGDDGREPIYERDGFWFWDPTISPDASEAAFTVLSDGREIPYALWIFNFSSGESRVLLEENSWNARWSPSGKWIAYATYEGPGSLPNVYLIRPDGSGKRAAVVDLSSDGPRDWFSDGTKLLYGTDLVNYSSNLGVYDLSTEKKTMITNFDDRNFSRMPAVSPNDEWIAGSQVPKGDWYTWALQLTYVRTDGTDYHVEIRENDAYLNGGVIDWSPDGRYLLFELMIQMYGDYREDTELWTYDTKTGAFEQLTMAPEGYSRPNPPHDDVTYETVQGAEWGPDGYIYFAADGKLYRIKAPE
jgi:Tol biopolymer transport system component